MKRNCSSYLALLFLVLSVVMQTSCQNDDKDSVSGKVNAGDVVPDFTVTSIDGQTVSSSSLSGQVYMLTFFDTGCQDCQKEFPVLQQIYDKYSSYLSMINVPRSQSLDEVKQYWTNKGLSIPVHKADDSRLYYKFADSGIPRTYIVDGKGVVQAVFTDNPIADFNTLDGILQDLLKEQMDAEKDEVKVKFQFRANGLETDEEYVEGENTITSVEVFIYHSETKKLAYRKAFTIDDIGHSSRDSYPRDSYIINQEISIKPGKYNIFAVANYPVPDDIVNQEQLLDICDSIPNYTSDMTGVLSNIPKEGPIMTNDPTSHVGIDIKFDPYKNVLISFDLIRTMAKFRIGVNPNNFPLKDPRIAEDTCYARIQITGYKLVNMSKCCYLFPHKDQVTEFHTKPEFVMPDNYGEFNDTEADLYTVDPFFYDKLPDEQSMKNLSNKFFLWFGSINTDNVNFAGFPYAGYYGHGYFMENTVFKSSQKNGYSPGVIFKATVSPTAVWKYNEKTNKVEPIKPENLPHTYYLYNCKFYYSIQAINVDNNLNLEDRDNYTDAELKSYKIKQVKNNNGVYETYYTYWIEHKKASDPMSAMRYGIVRNNYYQITVTGVSGLGESKITPQIMRDNYPNDYTDIIVQ